MQIEAIRAHPGSAHVMGLWHSQKSFLLHERNNNSSSAPAPALPGLGTWVGLVRGTPEPGQVPLLPPRGLSKPLEKDFPKEECLALPWRHQPCWQQVPTGSWGGRGEGTEGESIESLFLQQVRKLPPPGHRHALGPASKGKCFAEHQ